MTAVVKIIKLTDTNILKFSSIQAIFSTVRTTAALPKSTNMKPLFQNVLLLMLNAAAVYNLK